MCIDMTRVESMFWVHIPVIKSGVLVGWDWFNMIGGKLGGYFFFK